MKGRRFITIGITRETHGVWECRSPVTPSDMQKLKEHRFIVQPSAKRIFTDRQYQQVGATINNNLTECDLIIGVKQIKDIYPNKAHLFFSHTHKGQIQNLALLKKVLDQVFWSFIIRGQRY